MVRFPDCLRRTLLTMVLGLAVMLAHHRVDAAQLTLTWIDNAADEDGFTIERKDGAAGTYTAIATTGANVVAYADAGLTDGLTYCYRLFAFNGAGGSPYSNEACATAGMPAPVTIAATAGTATEAGPTAGQFTVTRTGSTGTPLTVTYTVGGTATAGTDYVALSGTVTIAAGSLTATIPVTPINDTVVEPDETVLVSLVAAAGYTVGSPASAVVTIVSDESLAMVKIHRNRRPKPGMSPATSGTFTVTRSGGTAASLTVRYTVGGSAISGKHYAPLADALVIPAGSIGAEITVSPLGGDSTNSDKSVVVVLGPSPTYTLGAPASAAAMISKGAVLPGVYIDVPETYWAGSWVEALYTDDVTVGCSVDPPLYCPDTAVTRAQMAAFLLRAKHGAEYGPAAPSGLFLDVPTSHWAASWIEELVREGMAAGCGEGKYCPESPVTRAQMAVFLLHATRGSAAVPAPTGRFGDVPTDYWAASWIEELAALGIAAGCGEGKYCPESPVTRAEMAVFLIRAFGLPD